MTYPKLIVGLAPLRNAFLLLKIPHELKVFYYRNTTRAILDVDMLSPRRRRELR